MPLRAVDVLLLRNASAGLCDNWLEGKTGVCVCVCVCVLGRLLRAQMFSYASLKVSRSTQCYPLVMVLIGEVMFHPCISFSRRCMGSRLPCGGSLPCNTCPKK
uniref:Uncharacterized protein n=1 Tax=Dunaliella tertiolecta TaxID=3047 RepID=A0A7S3R9E9_DUNTE